LNVSLEESIKHSSIVSCTFEEIKLSVSGTKYTAMLKEKILKKSAVGGKIPPLMCPREGL